MEDSNKEVVKPVTALPQPNKNRHGTLLKLAAIIVVALGAVTGVYFWQHQKLNNLNAKNLSLASQLATSQKTASSSKSSVSSSGGTISYQASTGFTLTLSDTYVIIKVNDGGGEGGPYTSLGIGNKTPITGVIGYDSQYTQPVIIARPISGTETFRSIVDSDLKDKGDTAKTTVMVDGVDAESYTYGGFGAPQSIYFTKNNIYYKIYTPENDIPLGKLGPIIAGFKFN